MAKWIGRPALTEAIHWYVTGWSWNVRRLVKSAYDTLMSRLHASRSVSVKPSANKNDGTSCSRTYWLQCRSLLPYLATCSISTLPNASWLPPVLRLSVTCYLPELMLYCELNGLHECQTHPLSMWSFWDFLILWLSIVKSVGNCVPPVHLILCHQYILFFACHYVLFEMYHLSVISKM